ncbi:hypothetical protein GGF40_003620, partial [Coemansia sp. RSA 1286]
LKFIVMKTATVVLAVIALVASALPAFAQASNSSDRELHGLEEHKHSFSGSWDSEHYGSMSHPPRSHGHGKGDRSGDHSWDSDHPRPSDASWASEKHFQADFVEGGSDKFNFGGHSHSGSDFHDGFSWDGQKPSDGFEIPAPSD